ncbi:uncharacterized protein LOC143462197 isoform X1 [Clavelina lepadiformis]|uniref:uncharacterized protein LOC143462197 isoform X1 n=1 Tax=Clavelina lepadiformis TaxID=159417 RepID=UPI0040436700
MAAVEDYSHTPYRFSKPKKGADKNGLKVPPCSGLYKGTLGYGHACKASLELKIDVDQLREFSQPLQYVSGSITVDGNGFPWIESSKGIYFRSFPGGVILDVDESGANYERAVSCDINVTRNDGVAFQGRATIILRLTQDDVMWMANVKIDVSGESVTFENVERTSLFFRTVAIDVDYVEKVAWPTIALSDFYETPDHLQERKLDAFAVFEDAGIKLLHDPEDRDKLEDPTPHNPWNRDDMYNVMMDNFDAYEGSEEADVTIWCMIANKPPDERYMGFSFDKGGRRGFGMFTGHKSFKALFDEAHENHPRANRRFLHYFVHECGHTLGLQHPFEIGRPNDLTWMNYAWRYDSIHGSGQFYKAFDFSFTKAELIVLRHAPSQDFLKCKLPHVQCGCYGVVKSLPVAEGLEGDVDDDDVNDGLSLKLTTRPQAYAVGELVELEIRLKNLGESPVMIDGDLDPEGGNVIVYVTGPDGSTKRLDSFVRPITGAPNAKPLFLYPAGDGEGAGRYRQLISIGEGSDGSYFNQPGIYSVKAAYVGGASNVYSNLIQVNVAEPTQDEMDSSAVAAAAKLGGSCHERFKSVETWQKIKALTVDKKKSYVHKLVQMFDGLTKNETRQTGVGSIIGKKRKRKEIQIGSGLLSKEDFLKGTEDLVVCFQKKGVKGDSMNYKELVFARAKIFIGKGEKENATSEFNQLIAHLVSRGVYLEAIKDLSKEFMKLSEPEPEVNKETSQYLQARVDEILDWYPKKKIKNSSELSGLGLNTIFSHFRDDHVAAGTKIVLLLFNILDETNDVSDVLDYADSLQKGYQVNHQVLQWSVEIFIIHSKLAKKSGIMYPVPPAKDQSLMSLAAVVVTSRTGRPEESWMNYWRSDADLNYHHRHWHSVYIVGREIGPSVDWFGGWRRNRPELDRQGELFGYMHSQMLARYNAERESWGLREVQPWDYDGRDRDGFNAGFEFHNDPRNSDMSPRPGASWPQNDRISFRQWENSYRAAVANGVLPAIRVLGRSAPQRFRMDFNLSGHVLEASSTTWQRWFGSIHNTGHGVFGSNRMLGGGSYMLSTATAMRDPIFYRWHKRIDDLWHLWNDTLLTDVDENPPPILILEDDILIKSSEEPLDNFANFRSSPGSDELVTVLGPAQKRFEWDNKIDHRPFYYHIRFRRTSPGDLNLTFRIFICPSRHVTDRKRWIEMDKFVYRLPSDEDTASIIRADRHSSVIKREPRFMDGDVETGTTSVVDGFCECGWPYNMLLPRGTAQGEQWQLCVFVSDNNLDQIRVRSSCGSLSFCGASGEQYPDERPMGYPFITDMALNGQPARIDRAIRAIPNAAMSPFVIRNNITTPSAVGLVDMWSPWGQLGQDDGTQPRSDEVTVFRRSNIVGRMRVLIDDRAMTMSNLQNVVAVRFQGRGPGGGSYRVTRAYVGYRNGTTVDLRPDIQVANIEVNGQSTFDVPEGGVISDPAPIRPGSGDLFVTFTLLSPGAFLSGRRGQPASTYVILNPEGETASSDRWSGFSDVRISPSIYCIGGVMQAIPDGRRR